MKRCLLLAVILLICVTSVWTQPLEPGQTIAPLGYQLGNQNFQLSLGMLIPLFFLNSNNGATAPTNLTLGVAGSLHYSFIIHPIMGLGAELGGAVAFSPNERALFMVPITLRYTLYLVAPPFEFPLHIGGGISISTFQGSTKIDPFLKIGATGIWNFAPPWGMGLNVEYWFVPQTYPGGSPPSSDSRIGNFMVVNLTAIYHL